MTTVLEVGAQGFRRNLYALYDIETQRRPKNSRWVQCVEKTEIISCFPRFLHFIWRANFWLLFELDTFASTYSRDLLPHTRGANGFCDKGHVVQSFSARWRQARKTTDCVYRTSKVGSPLGVARVSRFPARESVAIQSTDYQDALHTLQYTSISFNLISLIVFGISNKYRLLLNQRNFIPNNVGINNNRVEISQMNHSSMKIHFQSLIHFFKSF